MKKLLFSSMVLTGTILAADIEIKDAVAKASIANRPNSAAFFTIVNNTNKDISLVSASSNISNKTELHTHIKEDNMMKMVKVDKIDVKAKSQTKLRPGGDHVMFLGLNQPLEEGKTISLKLTFSNNQVIELKDVKIIDINKMTLKKQRQNNK